MRSLSLVEVVVAIGIFSVLFLSLFAIFWLNFRLIFLFERKVAATQIAQGEIEKIRNLPYLQVGTIGAQLPYAFGTLEASTSTVLNNVEYKIERKIKYIYDPADGDEICPLDYKRAQIKVSFSGILKGEVILETDVVPKDKTEEVTACTLQPVGILSVQVLNSVGEFVPSPTIQIFDQTGNLRDSVTPSSGKYDFPLSPGTYRVLVSKEGYSSERTYGTDEIAIPEKPNPIVLEGKITQITFSIDRLSSMLVRTFGAAGTKFFSDSFDDESKISEKENVLVSGGQVTLATSAEGYLPSGYLFSVEISPVGLIEWGEFSFTDEEPEGTDLKYQIFFASGTQWLLVEDSDLPGNSVGFDQSPVSLKNLSTTTYSKLKIKANFSTQNSSLTPILRDWQLSYRTIYGVEIPEVKFDLRGEKIIGRDAQENLIYKFSTTTQTDAQGKVLLEKLEWDNYQFSNFQKDSQALELVTSTPSHPVSLAPNTSLEVYLFLQAQNSLLVTVQDSETSNPIFQATTTLTAPGFSQTQFTGADGQTIFIPLEQKTYTLSVEAQGYYSTSTQVFVSGKTSILIRLEARD